MNCPMKGYWRRMMNCAPMSRWPVLSSRHPRSCQSYRAPGSNVRTNYAKSDWPTDWRRTGGRPYAIAPVNFSTPARGFPLKVVINQHHHHVDDKRWRRHRSSPSRAVPNPRHHHSLLACQHLGQEMILISSILVFQ